MARVKVIIPNISPIYTNNINIRITDINYGNHLGNDSVLSLTHEARVQALGHYGLTEMDIGSGVSLIMADAAIQFLQEVRYGQTLTIQIFIDILSTRSFDMYYHFLYKDGLEVAKVKTGMIAYDYKERKVAMLPSSFIAKFSHDY